jgi:hypothetical protein
VHLLYRDRGCAAVLSQVEQVNSLQSACGPSENEKVANMGLALLLVLWS